MSPDATFPFGAPLRRVVQEDRTPKRVFVLGVYASAVHATWLDRDGRVLVRALAVASEPSIFWKGEGAEAIVASVQVPERAGYLLPAEPDLNGPSGRSLDRDILGPLGLTRADAWLCDLLPHACMNPAQRAALGRAYEPRRFLLDLPPVTLPDVPEILADAQRRSEILEEIEAACPEVLALLGDQPIRHFLTHLDPRWRALSDFGVGDDYGRLHKVTLNGRRLQVLPLAHPRQVAGLGSHSGRWREMHAAWKRRTAPALLPVASTARTA